MAVQSDLISAINQISAERNIDPREVLEAIKEAIKTGFKKDYQEEENDSMLQVEINPEFGSINVYVNKKIVKDVTDTKTQVALSDAKNINPALKEGDHLLIDVTPSGDFGRVAAQAAKQVILQKIRESEKETVMKEFTDKMGEIEYGVVQRMDGDSVVFEIRRAIAIMPLEDRIPVEYYKSGNKMKVLLKEIRMTQKGKQLIVSRADAGFLKGLFKLEVPEIDSDSVVINSVAREAGSRSKVAVSSRTDGIDPIGACVGQKGVRISSVMNELRFGNTEEKIDIILFDEDIQTFIANALSPAKVLKVEIIDKDAKHALVQVPDDQFSLAIGREGQNVRLAAKLTGWNIDIEGETIKLEKKVVAPTQKVEAIAEEKVVKEEVEKEEVAAIETKEVKSDKKVATKKKTVAKAVAKAATKASVKAKAKTKLEKEVKETKKKSVKKVEKVEVKPAKKVVKKTVAKKVSKSKK